MVDGGNKMSKIPENHKIIFNEDDRIKIIFNENVIDEFIKTYIENCFNEFLNELGVEFNGYFDITVSLSPKEGVKKC